MKTIEEKAMQRAWCEYRGVEYVEGFVNPLPSDNFEKGYMLGRRDALAGQWRSVEDELPKEYDEVVVIFTHPIHPNITEYAVAYYDGEDWYTVDGEHIRPTHWLPIPAPPKSESE